MLELWLIRHGETVWNAEHRIQGQSDAPLSERGLEQAARLGARLKHTSFDQVFSSDSGRARRTAEIALPGYTIEADIRLRELSYGSLEGKIRAEFVSAEAAAFTAHRRDPYAVPMPEGESWRDLDVRVNAWLNELPSEGRVAAFSHGGTVRGVLFTLTGIPKKREWNVFFGNTSVTRLRLGEVPTLISVNDTAHLEAWADAASETGLEAELSAT